MKRKKIITYKEEEFTLKVTVELTSTGGFMRYETNRKFTMVLDLLVNALAQRLSVSQIKLK